MAPEPFIKAVCRCVFEGLAFVCVAFNVHLQSNTNPPEKWERWENLIWYNSKLVSSNLYGMSTQYCVNLAFCNFLFFYAFITN